MPSPKETGLCCCQYGEKENKCLSKKHCCEDPEILAKKEKTIKIFLHVAAYFFSENIFSPEFFQL